MSSIAKAISLSLLLTACLGLTQSVGAQTREDPQQQASVNEDDGLAFYDADAGTYYAGIWQHLTAPSNLEKDSKSPLSDPANRLTDKNFNTN